MLTTTGSPEFTASVLPNSKANRSFASGQLEILLECVPKSGHFLPHNSSMKVLAHLYKTGGTSVWFFYQAMAAVAGFKWHRFAAPRIAGVSPNRTVLGQDRLEKAREYLGQDPTFCDQFKIISGHFPVGLDELINQNREEKDKKEIAYLTLVEHPVKRALSEVNFDFQRDYVSKEDAETYLLSAVDNLQTRFLAGEEAMKKGYACTAETLQKAKDNIEKRFLLAAPTEDANSFMSVLAAIESWQQPIAMCRAQVTGDKVFRDISSTLRATLEEKHKFDVELYEWIKTRWYKWKAENIDFVPRIMKPEEKVICILSEFGNNPKRVPQQFSLEEFQAYNAKAAASGNHLVELTQSVASAPRAPVAPPTASVSSALPTFGLYIDAQVAEAPSLVSAKSTHPIHKRRWHS